MLITLLMLERVTGYQEVEDSIPVWGSEIGFLMIELGDRLFIIHSQKLLL